MIISQFFIAIFGVTAIWLSQQSDLTLRRYAPVLGLLSQPFWFYSSWVSGSYGIFALSFFYSYAWGLGLYNHWVKQ